MAGFRMRRLGLVMEPEPGNALEVEGVLNPAGVRGPDGQFYLFPRLVANGNYSRIGIARVNFDDAGDPAGVERLGIALEPEADFERRSDGSGGCEDPRITFSEDLKRYVMTYTALSSKGPRIALALSDPSHFTLHRRLASPVVPWEFLKIGGGTPPILTRHGWLVIYHGVCDSAKSSAGRPKLCYSAGVLVLSREHPLVIRYRSPEPVLMPELPQERVGTVANIVFPTAIDRRDDLGSPDRFDVYYGLADSRIGVARLDVPEFLPPGALDLSQPLTTRPSVTPPAIHKR
jgi:predicted GH43/DUF377 family glycosyl hydrolase